MSFVVIIVVLIIIIIFLLIFSFGFLLGLNRKKKDLKRLEAEQEKQKKRQESIINYFLKENMPEENTETQILPVKIITRGYKRIKKFLKIKKRFEDIINDNTVKYLRKYFLSYIGIAVFILGIGYFIKNSADIASVNIVGKIIITLFVSLLFIVTAHLIFKKFKTFSSILTGGGIGILYISFTVTYYSFDILSDLQAFVIYFIITLFGVLLSLSYNRFELLFLAITAGFAAPLFSGIYNENNTPLLIYLLTLNLGAVFISLKFNNFLLKLIPSIFTGIYLILTVRYSYQNEIYNNFQTDFIMLNILYFVMIILSVIYHVIHKKEYKLYELMTVVVINLIYYSIGMYMLKVLNPDYKGVFTALAAAFNLIFLIIMILIRKSVDDQLIYFFGIISLLFLTLIPPVELVGKSLTMIWAVETVLLMWLSVKLDIKMLKFVTTFLMLGLIASFILDVIDNFFAVSFNAPDRKLLINKSFVSGLMTSLGLGLNAVISGKSKDVYLIKPIKMSWLRIFISVIAVGALYISLYTEILYKVTVTVKDARFINIMLGVYNFAFILLILTVLNFIKNKFLKISAGFLGIASVILFFAYYLYEIISLREHIINNPSIPLSKFNIHVYITGILLFILFFAYLNIKTLNEKINNAAKWILTLSLTAVLTSELDHIAVIKSFGSGIPVSSVISETHYYAYSLFWTLIAFIISLSALIFKDTGLVKIAIFFLFVVIIKSFIFDFQELSIDRQIINFTTLGTAILFTAFVRQKLFEQLK